MPRRPAIQADVVDGLDDVRASGIARLVVRGVGDRDPPDGAQERRELRHVERGRDGLAPARLAHQREIGDRDAPAASSVAISTRRASPLPLQEEPSTTSRSAMSDQLACRGTPERRLARPPQRDRQVVDQERRDQRVQVPPGLPAAGQVDHLGAGFGRVRARDHAERLDLCVEPRRPVRIRRRDDHRPRRVAARELRDGRGCPLADLRPPGDHDEVEHAGPRRDMALAVLAGRHGARRSCPDLAASSRWISSSVWARDDQRSTGCPGRTSAAATGATAVLPPASPIRSAASGGRRARSGGRRPPDPTSRRRSSGTRAVARPATRR